jgi:serine/threonine-protein kinase HipA
VAESLAIWLYGHRIAMVERERKGRLRLAYTEDALQTYEPGAPLLSVGLPLTRTRYPNAVTKAFLDGLLPEGEARLVIAADFDLPASDVFGLLAALGRDCAGAMIVQPWEDSPPGVLTTLMAEPVSDDELAELVANLRSAPLGVGRHVRLSLAGVQEKLLLTRMPDGGWGRPIDGTPSTHILKPEIDRLGGTVENEAFCMRVARHLGLPAAHVETTVVDGRPVLIVERYDRVVGPDGVVRRVHQEDLCQALGLPPDRKYEQDAGPTLARSARLLQDMADPSSLDAFLCALTLNVALGNCDAHGKNFSLLHTESGGLRLAPLYDLMATRLYPVDDKLAMYVDGVQRADRVTTGRIVNEAASWSMSRARATELIADCLDRLPAAVSAAAGELDGVQPELVELVEERIASLRCSAPPTGR